MPYNKEILGSTRTIELITLELLAGNVPEEVKIVEIGSYKVGSAWTLAKSCHPGVTLTCIDIYLDVATFHR